MITVLVVSLVLFMLLTVPIGIALGLSTLVVFWIYYPGTPMSTMLSQAMVTTPDSFALLAVPLFMLVGTVMDKSGIAIRIVKLAEAVVGSSPGGLAAAAIAAAALLSAISGSGPGVTAAVGVILVPAMIASGYGRAYAGTIVAAGSIVGPIIPPSIALIIFGATMGVSVVKLFIAGIVPGLLLTLALLTYNYMVSKKRGYRGKPRTEQAERVWPLFFEALPGLLMPVIVLGGIYAGIFSPTESAVVGVIYAILVGAFYYRELSWSKLQQAILDAALLTAIVMILVGASTTFGRLLMLERIPDALMTGMLGLTESKILIMLLIMIFLLITGMFIDTISNIILFSPLFVPVIIALGYDPVFFGVIMIINLCIGFLTPPVGFNLFIAAGIAKVSIEAISREALTPVMICLMVLITLIVFPEIVMFLPNILG